MTQTPWIISILIGLFSGGIGAILTYSFNYRKERSQFLRERAEQIYLHLDNFGRWISIMYIERKTGDLSDSGKDPTLLSKAIEDYRKTFAMCEIYFPHIMPTMNELLDVRDRLALALKDAGAKEGYADEVALQFDDILRRAKLKISHQCRRPLDNVTYVKLLDSPWN